MGIRWLSTRERTSIGVPARRDDAGPSPRIPIRQQSSIFLRFAVLAVLVASLSTCDDEPLPTDPVPAPPTAAISDGAHLGGNPGFFFLPPLVPDPSAHEDFDADGFDPTRLPLVEICALDDTDCSSSQPEGLPIRYTLTSGPGSESIRLVEEEQQFTVNWHTDVVALDPETVYRIRVLVGSDIELGFADIDVVSSGRELRNVDTDQYIALKDGRTLPIKFRIETDATEAPPDIAIEVSEGIHVADRTNMLESLILSVTETIHVGDDVAITPPVTVHVDEIVHVMDDVAVAPPAWIAVTEAINVTDAPAVLPPAVITVAERITVTDRPAVSAQ